VSARRLPLPSGCDNIIDSLFVLQNPQYWYCGKPQYRNRSEKANLHAFIIRNKDNKKTAPIKVKRRCMA
jgi:hypothetical protein